MSKNYIDNKEMYQAFVDYRELGEYDPEVYELRKKNFKGLKIDENGIPDLDSITDEPEYIKKVDKDKNVTYVLRKNRKLKSELLDIAKERQRLDKIYKERCELRAKNETEEETILRTKKFNRVKEQIGKYFLLIANNLLNLSLFVNYTKDRQNALVSDATWAMLRYMSRFNLKQTNPFSYFTSACKNAFVFKVREDQKEANVCKSLSFIEDLNCNEIMVIE